MEIEIFYFEGCPHWREALHRIEEVLAEEGGVHEIRLILVETLDDAKKHGFFGSPTVRIDGRDIDPAAWGRIDYGFSCRFYQSADGSVHPLPSKELLRRSVQSRRPLSISEAHDEVLEAIKHQHPHWVTGTMGECPRCVRYEYELADPLALPPEE
ncbi:MAG: hypothetical protein AB7T14_07565 [Candidatus Methylacidiphilaceae bacterium]